MTRPRSVHFGLNVLWNLLGQASLLFLSFALVPYLIHHLGLEGYALYGLMGVLAGYLTLLAFGAMGVTPKFLSEYIGRQSPQGVRTTLTIGFLMQVAGVAAGSVAAFIFRDRLALKFFHVSQPLRGDAAWILGCAALGATFFSITQFAQSAFSGLQLFGESNLISLAQTGSMLGGAALLLYFHFTLRDIGAYFVIVQIALAAASLLALFPRLPKATWSARPVDGATARRFFSFTTQGFFAQMAWSAMFQWDKLIIGYFIVLSQLTYYLIPANIMQRFLMLPGSISSAAYPLISELHGAGNKASLRKVYRQCGQLILWIVVPAFVFLFVVAPQFLTLWLGPKFSDYGVWPLRWLLLGYALYYMAIMPNTAATGTDKPHYTLAWQMIQAGLCVVSWIVLVPRVGIVGAAFGFFLAQALSGLPYAYLVSKRLFSMSFLEYFDGIVLRPLAAGILLFALLWPLRTHATTWASLLSLGVGAAVAYYAGGFWLLDAEERDTLERLTRGFLESLRGG